MALSLIPSSSSNAPQFKYDVFLSFRALSDKQLEIFIDYNLNRGDEISPSLLEAIEKSQLSIIIFSRTYASSSWCLEELVKILECREQYGQIVIPVFYGIDPSGVRYQTGSFADAFAEHGQQTSYKVQRWKDALKKAANLSGWQSTANKPESVLMEDIVQNVLKRLNDMSSVDTSDLVGIDSKIAKIESLLCIGTNDARSVGIWSIGGIGKTTLAEAVFNKISSQFEGFCFTYHVRERSEQNSGLNQLRQELRLAIFGDGNMNVCTSIVGHDFTRNRLNGKKLLLVFDDVSNFGQIEYLIGDLRCLSSQSRIIITTRDKQVLKNCRVNQVYEVRELFHDEALKLFCMYAFKRNHPMMGYVELSNKVAGYAQGVPLALKVLGSHLLDKGKVVWKSAMDKLEKFPHIDIHKVLKVSYEGLDDEVRKIFLDIACFLKGCDVGLAKSILNACGFHSEIGISILIDQEIVSQESIENSGEHSRLWDPEDIYYVLIKNMGTKIIEGISLDMSQTRDIHLDRNTFTNMRRLRFLNFYSGKVGFFNYYRGEVENKVYGFEAVKLDLPELRYLRWDGCPIKSPLSSFHLENLVKLDMCYSKVEQIWTDVKIDAISMMEVAKIFIAIGDQGVSFKSRFQPVDDYDIFADFGNCFKLDRNTFEGIMKDVLLRTRVLLKTRVLMEYIDEDYEYTLETSVVCYPGYEIPEWFNFRSMGSLINVELPQNSLNHNFLCFVFCVIVDNTWSLHWKCNLRSKDGHPCIWDGICDYEFDFIESHHVLVASEHEISPDVLLDYENEISFEFYFHDDSMEGYTVEKCGVHLMIAQLPEEPNVSFRVGEVEDILSLASVHDNCERVNEPHPKRLKFN
ncbi:hypothetical protein ACOSQ3_032484 [Xanthoceras sorbifolium]